MRPICAMAASAMKSWHCIGPAIVSASDAAAIKKAARDAYIPTLRIPGRNPTDAAGVYPYSAAAEGTTCIIDGASGTLVREGNSLVCRPTKLADAMTMDEIYEEYSRTVGNAWRTP